MSETTAQPRRWADLANPTYFVAFADRFAPWLAGFSAVILAAGLWMSFAAPEDYQQGTTVRIMYIHVPFAWLSMFCYTIMAVAALGTLVWRHPLADVSLKAAAPIGAVFTALALITGSLWGKPMWGAWWVWDARLTSVLVMLFLYLGYLALWQVTGESARAARASSILAVVGVINLPVIKFSVEWWSTLHQPASVIRLGGPAIDASMLTPLLIMAGAYFFYFLTVFLWLAQAEIARHRAEALMREQTKWG